MSSDDNGVDDNGFAREKVLADPNLVSKVNEWAVQYTLLGVEGGDRDDQSARVVPIHVSKNKLEPNNKGNLMTVANDVTVGRPIAVGKVNHGHDSRMRYQLLVGQDNGRIAVAETDPETGDHYVRYGVEQPATMQPKVKLPEKPHAIHVYGTAVYLGFSTSVQWIDFSSSTPECTLVYERPEMDYRMFSKAYDLFTRDGDFLVAVDDIIRPYYADSFRLVGDNHEPTHQDAYTLPENSHGHYDMAAIDGDELLVTYPYFDARFNGGGQVLYRLKFSDIKTSSTSSTQQLRVNVGVSLGEYDYPESDSRSTITENSIGGMTRWTGLAVRGDSILLAAGDRGLLVLPTKFTQEGKAQTIKLGGGPVDSVCVAAEGDTWVTTGQTLLDRLSFLTPTGEKYKLGKVNDLETGEFHIDVSLPGKFKLLS